MLSFATTQPHASHTAFTHGVVSKWNYYFCTNAGISELLSPLRSAVRSCFLPKLVPHAISDVECKLFSYPVCLGCLGICNLMLASNEQHEFSRTLLRCFVDLVVAQTSVLRPVVVHHQNDLFHCLSSLTEQCNQLSLIVLHLCAGLLSAAWRRGLPPGCLNFHLNSKVFLFTKVNSLMLFVYGLALHCHWYHCTVCVCGYLVPRP